MLFYYSFDDEKCKLFFLLEFGFNNIFFFIELFLVVLSIVFL